MCFVRDAKGHRTEAPHRRPHARFKLSRKICTHDEIIIPVLLYAQLGGGTLLALHQQQGGTQSRPSVWLPSHSMRHDIAPCFSFARFKRDPHHPFKQEVHFEVSPLI
jgi:hypothetical protein